MRIVNFQQFIELPAGTLFAKYEPMRTEDVSVKEATIGDAKYPDFIYTDFTGVGIVDAQSSSDLHDQMCEAEKSPISLKCDFEVTARDGLYNKEQLFLIYEEADINGMIAKLNECLTVIPQVKEKLCQFQGAVS